MTMVLNMPLLKMQLLPSYERKKNHLVGKNDSWLTLKNSKMPIQANPNAASHGLMEVMFLKTPIHVLTKPRPGTCNQDKNKLITTSCKRPLSHVTRKWDVFSVGICSGSRSGLLVWRPTGSEIKSHSCYGRSRGGGSLKKKWTQFYFHAHFLRENKELTVSCHGSGKKCDVLIWPYMGGQLTVPPLLGPPNAAGLVNAYVPLPEPKFTHRGPFIKNFEGPPYDDFIINSYLKPQEAFDLTRGHLYGNGWGEGWYNRGRYVVDQATQIQKSRQNLNETNVEWQG